MRSPATQRWPLPRWRSVARMIDGTHPGDDGGVGRHHALRALAGGRAAGHRGPRPGRRGAGRRRRRVPRSGAGRRRGVRRGRPRARAHHRPRRRRVRRRRPAAHRRAGGGVGPLRADVVGRRRHRAVLGPARRRRPRPRLDRRARHDDGRHGPHPPAHRDDRPHPRHPRRADDVRRQGRAVGPAAGAGPDPPRRGPGVDRRVQAVGRRRDVLQRRAGDRAVRRRAARAAAGAGDAGDRQGPPRRAALRAGLDGGDVRARRRRAAPPPAHRGVRGPRGLQAGPEGLVGDAPQAQPDLGRDDQRSGPGRALQPARRTAGCRAVARAGHLPFVGRAGRAARFIDARALHDPPTRTGCCARSRSTKRGCATTCGRAMDSCSASPSCWRSWRRAAPATMRIGSSSATPWRRGRSGRDFRTLLENDPEMALGKEALDEAFDLERSLRHLDRVGAALDEIRPTG